MGEYWSFLWVSIGVSAVGAGDALLGTIFLTVPTFLSFRFPTPPLLSF